MICSHAATSAAPHVTPHALLERARHMCPPQGIVVLDVCLCRRAEHQACNWRLGGNEEEPEEPLFYELLHGRDMLLFADMLVEQGLLLDSDQEGSTSAKRPDVEPLQLKSQLELQWYSGYNDCLEVTLGFSVLSDETDEWSGVSPADGRMQRVLRALDWQ